MRNGEALQGSVALVTGASSGIGAATARSLAAAGARVAVTARRLDKLEQLVAEISTADNDAIAIRLDMADPAQAGAAVTRTVDEWGRLDILVNNAGVMLLGPIADAPTEEWARMIDLNVRALIETTRAALPHLLDAATGSARGCADVVNVSSVSGRVARRGSGVYSLTKFGIGAFTEALRQELAETSVRTLVIEPGTVDTELVQHLREGVKEAVIEGAAGFRHLDAADVAEAIAYAVTRPSHVSLNEVLIRPTKEPD